MHYGLGLTYGKNDTALDSPENDESDTAQPDDRAPADH
jgi:hypothetical protein